MGNTYLKHHGILGQKWGVRNGPPYPLTGRTMSSSEKRASRRGTTGGDYGEEQKKNKGGADIAPVAKAANKAVESAKQATDDIIKTRQRERQRKMDLSDMSDDELKKVINRLELEKRYKDLAPSDVKRGEEIAKNVLEVMGAVSASVVAALAVYGFVKQFG